MKKTGLVTGMFLAGLIGMGAYTLMNKNTKGKADKLINNLLDKANTMSSISMNKQRNNPLFIFFKIYYVIFGI